MNLPGNCLTNSYYKNPYKQFLFSEKVEVAQAPRNIELQLQLHLNTQKAFYSKKLSVLVILYWKIASGDIFHVHVAVFRHEFG